MDAQQFQRQILCYSDKMYRMARSILLDESGAKDAFQDLVLRLWERRDQLDIIENKQAFSLTSMRNLCVDLLRKKLEYGGLTADIVSSAPDPQQELEEQDSLHNIHRLIDSLPELQRTIVRMKDVEEIEIREIAQILYMSENAVTVNLSRARKKLRDMIVTIQQSEEKQYERNR